MSNPTLIEALLAAVDSRPVLAVLDFEVIAYTASKQTVDIRPCTRDRRIGEDGVIEAPEAPTVYAVPVRWPSGGGRSLIWGLSAGDIVTGLIRSRSHDEVDSGSAVPTIPAAGRRWDLADACVYPSGLLPGVDLAAGYWRSDGQAVLRMPTGEALFVGDSTANKTLALAQETAAKVARIENYLNTMTLAVAGAVTVVAAPPPFTGAPVTTPTCTASVAVPAAATTTANLQSTRLKVDT